MASLTKFRPRLLPLTIFAAALTLTVKVKEIWLGFQAPVLSQAVGAEKGTPAPSSTITGTAQNVGSKQPERKKPLPALGGPMVPADSPDAAGPAAEEAVPSGNAFTQAEVDLVQKLAERRKELDTRSRDLDMREDLLKAAQQRIDAKVTELKALQASIEALVKQHDDQEEAQIRNLVKIYEAMKPPKAARIFEQLDMPILMDVVGRMKDTKLATILAEMDPIKAKALTAQLAQHRQIPIPGG